MQSSVARSYTNWTKELDDNLLGLKARGTTNVKISEVLGIPTTTCHRRYHELTEKAVEWDQNMDEKLRMAYQKYQDKVWETVANELGVHWRAAENRAWDLGKKKIVNK